MSGERPGEFELIDMIRSLRGPRPSWLVQDIGDDCAVCEWPLPRRLLVTTDLLVEGVHFPSGRLHPGLIGRKSLLVNVSDIAAMGGTPLACFLGLALPADSSPQDFDSFMRGFLEEASRFGVVLAGGDLSRGDRLTVSVTVLGGVESGEPITRNGARPGDLLLLVGTVGASRHGLEQILSDPGLDLTEAADEASLRQQFADDPRLAGLLAHLLPTIHLEEARWLQGRGLAHAMLDISDGLAGDVGHICKAGGVTGVIDLRRLPLPPSAGCGEQARELALNGGEDYALAVAVSGEQWERIQLEYPAGFRRPVPVGRFIEGLPTVLIEDDAGTRPCPLRSFDHFKPGPR